jgi:hypothetical protein
MNILGTLLEELRAAREAGLSFAQAWPDAAVKALEPLDNLDRTEWATVLSKTRTAWGRAYRYEEPTRAEIAAGRMVMLRDAVTA